MDIVNSSFSQTETHIKSAITAELARARKTEDFARVRERCKKHTVGNLHGPKQVIRAIRTGAQARGRTKQRKTYKNHKICSRNTNKVNKDTAVRSSLGGERCIQYEQAMNLHLPQGIPRRERGPYVTYGRQRKMGTGDHQLSLYLKLWVNDYLNLNMFNESGDFQRIKC